MGTAKTVGSRASVARLALSLAGLAMLAALLLAPRHTAAQSYSSGQPVFPAFEGWERNDDGSFNFVFGYMNENWQEEPNVPIGPDNNIQPGAADQGQPTHFQPRRNRFVFRVRVPKDFGADKEMIWTLTTQGKPQKAYATLRIDSLIENIDIMSETGALGAGSSSPQIRADKAPTVAIEGTATRTAKVGQPVALTAVVTDDGIPKTGPPQAARGRNPGLQPPFRPTVNKSLGLHVSWYMYRGAGKVSFEPAPVKAWEDTRTGANSPWAPYWVAPPVPPEGKYATQATFDQPGTYVLCARADDGLLTSDAMVTINVTR